MDRDTAGQERYHSLAPMYYRGAAAAIIVYDITSVDSFARAKAWVRELQRQGNPSMIMALAGARGAAQAAVAKAGGPAGAAVARILGAQRGVWKPSTRVQRLWSWVHGDRIRSPCGHARQMRALVHGDVGARQRPKAGAGPCF